MAVPLLSPDMFWEHVKRRGVRKLRADLRRWSSAAGLHWRSQATDWIYALAHVLDQSHDRRPAFRIRNGRYIALWLVHQQINVAFSAVQELAINFDVVAIKISLGPSSVMTCPFTVTRPAVISSSGFAARGYACRCDYFCNLSGGNLSLQNFLRQSGQPPAHLFCRVSGLKRQ